MIRAIIFDCFGVLCTEGWLPFKRKYFSADAVLADQANDLSLRLNAGDVSNDEFVTAIADLAGVAKQEAISAIHHNVPDEELFTYIRDHLQGTYKLGILSNAGGDRLRELFSPEQIALFEVKSLSFRSGFVKPESGAYEQAAFGLGAEAGECVFVDDQERHCAGAREAGMRAIVYKDFEQFRDELEALLAKSRDTSDKTSGDPKN